MRPDEYPIQELIAQRAPMIMVDRLLNSDEKSAEGCLLIRESNLFCIDGHLREAGMIEFVSQTASASEGYRRLVAGKAIGRGILSMVKDFVIHSLPAVNTEIRSVITIMDQVVGHTIIKGEIFQGNRMIASGELRFMTGFQD